MSNVVGAPGEIRAVITVTRKDGRVETFNLVGRVPVDHSASGALAGVGAELSSEQPHGSDTLDRGA